MKEHGMYFGKRNFYKIIRKKNGGLWNDIKRKTNHLSCKI